MIPYVAKPGETIVGLGFDFGRRLADGETLSTVSVTAPPPLSKVAESVAGTEAVVQLSVSDDAADGDYPVIFAVTGTAGSVRKAARTVLVRAVSD